MLIAQRPTLSEESVDEFRSRFVIEPLEPGFGYTLGNSLRRTLLSSIPGASVTSIKVDIPSFQVTAYDIIDVREKSLEMTPFIVARETHAERVVPAWLEAVPTRMRVLVHQLPVRAQIDVQVTEQLIVEYYSKK